MRNLACREYGLVERGDSKSCLIVLVLRLCGSVMLAKQVYIGLRLLLRIVVVVTALVLLHTGHEVT